MVTFCIKHMGVEKYFQTSSPLRVPTNPFARKHILHNIYDIPQPKKRRLGEPANITIWIFGVLS